jgi:hypothetical protein
VAEVAVGAAPTEINRLPTGELVIDNGEGDGLLFVDADTRSVVAESALPLPPPSFP